jgi:hypothetical protein
MYKLLLLLVFLVIGTPAYAANTTCATRPSGDSSNACASTAFVTNNFVPLTDLPLSVINGGTGNTSFTSGDLLVGNGTSALSQNTLTALLDSNFGSTQGSILYRGASAWTTLGPGTSGYYLKTQGSAANPVWASVSSSSITQECLPIEKYGGAGDNTTDNLGPFNTALAALTASGGCIGFGGGIYYFSGSPTYTMPNGQMGITLQGAGVGVTTIGFSNSTNGFAFILHDNTDTFSVKDLAILTNTNGADSGIFAQYSGSSIGFSAISAQSNISNVYLGGNARTTECWGAGVNINGVDAVNFVSVTVAGGGTCTGEGILTNALHESGTTNNTTSTSSNILHFASTPAGIYTNQFAFDVSLSAYPGGCNLGTVSSTASTTVTLNANSTCNVASGDTIIFQDLNALYNCTNCTFQGLAIGINYGTGTQGWQITNSNFNNFSSGHGIGIEAPCNEGGLVGLSVTNSQFNTGLSQIDTCTQVYDVNLTNNIFYNVNTSGSYPAIYGGFTRFSITGNSIVNEAGSAGSSIGIRQSASGAYGIIQGNTLQNYGTAVVLDSGSSNIFVGINNFLGNSNNISNSGTGNASPTSCSGSPSSSFGVTQGIITHC